jgi:uncharacterized protein (DUF1778 family)
MPKKPPKPVEPKDEFVRVRVNSEQKRRLQEAADRKGLDLSSWVRMVALKAAESGE